MSGETEQDVSGWTTDTLHWHLAEQIRDLRRMLQERYETQTKAVDAAFLAQQTAMQTALTAAERAVATALLSAEKAVTKAEGAAEKRFEAVNEFRGQLADQAATLLSRSEADVRIGSLAEKIDALSSRLDVIQGQTSGSATTRTAVTAAAAVLVSLMAIAVTLIVTLN